MIRGNYPLIIGNMGYRDIGIYIGINIGIGNTIL